MAGPIAIVCAMDWEMAHARTLLASSESALDVVPVVSGIGMVSAAAAAQATIVRCAPRAIVNYGCAGAHRLELLPGDLVVGERVVAYDNTREMPDGAVEYRGMYYRRDGEQQRADVLASDTALVAAARRVAETIEHEPWPVELGWPDGVAHRPPRALFGTVASADRWNRAPATIARLVARHDSLCEDMEAAAIGLVCASRGVPFLTIKDVSNNELLRSTASGRAMLDEIGPAQLARRAAAFTLAVLRAL